MQNTQTWQGMQPANQTQLSDQEIAYDLLYQEKALMSNICAEVMELSHCGLRTVLNDSFLQIGQDQFKLFEAMNAQGWYQTKPAQQADISTAKQKFQQMRNTL